MVWEVAVSLRHHWSTDHDSFVFQPDRHSGQRQSVIDAPTCGFCRTIGGYHSDPQFAGGPPVIIKQRAATHQDGVEQPQCLNALQRVHAFEQLHRGEGGIATRRIRPQLLRRIRELRHLKPRRQVDERGVNARHQ